MAPITVEDRIDKFPNRYELVLMAAYRTRLLAHGSPATVDTNRDKPAVVALREIAEGTIPSDVLRQALIHSLQYNVEVDEPDATAAPLLTGREHARFSEGKGDDVTEELTEEQLLKAMQRLLPLDPSVPKSDRDTGSDSEKEE
jgi:DNA-directed RNA polymerase subunit omega